MNSGSIKNYAIAVFFVVLAICAVIVTRFVTTRGDVIVSDVSATTQDTRKALNSVLAYADEQTTANKKSIDATIQLGAVLNGSARLLNRQVIPRIMRNLDSLDETIKDSTRTVNSLDRLVANTDREVNSKLLPEITNLVSSLTATADTLGLTAQETNEAIKIAAGKINLSLDEMYKLMSSRAWMNTLENIEKVTSSAAQTSANVSVASEQAPSIAQSLEKIAKTSSRFTKITLAANLLAILARAFLP